MTAQANSPRLILIGEISAFCLWLVMMGYGLYHTLTRWELGGTDLVLVGVLIVNWVSLLRFHLSQAEARIDELEKKLAM